VLQPCAAGLGDSSLVTRLRAGASHLPTKGQPRFSRCQPGARKRCPQAKRGGRQPTNTPKSTKGWCQPCPLKGGSHLAAHILLALAHLAERGTAAVQQHAWSGWGGHQFMFPKHTLKKKLVPLTLTSYPTVAKSGSTLAVSVGCTGRGGQVPNSKPSALSPVQGSVPQAKGLRHPTSPCYAFVF